MKNRIIIAAILVLLTIHGVQNAPAQNNGRTDGTVEAEIAKVVKDYYDAWHRGDEAAVMSLHADDGFYYNERHGYENFELATQHFRSHFKTPETDRPKFSYLIDDLKVTVAGADTAIANYKIVTKMAQGSMTRDIEERYTNIFAKRNGRWKLIAEHSSEIPKTIEEAVSGMPLGWIRTPLGTAERYAMTVDTQVKHGGGASALLKFVCGDPSGFGSLAQSIAADEYLGKRIRLSGWLKTENADEAGLWMRLDGFNRLLGFDNMMPRAVKGTTDWKRYEVVLDVPSETVNIFFGTLLSGTGRVWVDDLILETVGKDVPTTNQLSADAMRIETPNRGSKKSASRSPSNLAFEDGRRP